jgi:hypothetical protein
MDREVQMCKLLGFAQQAVVSEKITRSDWFEEDGTA